MPDKQYQDGLDRYKRVEGIECPVEKRPTIEQASAFLEVLRKKDSIYGDYAILVPHGDRALMRRHFTSRVMTSTGEWQTMEVYGPPCYKDWLDCHHIFTSLIICSMWFLVVPSGGMEKWWVSWMLATRKPGGLYTKRTCAPGTSTPGE